MMVKNRIREYRTERNMSQIELSNMLPDAPGKTILSLIENGHVLPTREMLDALCDAFGCTMYDLYDEPDADFIVKASDGGDLGNSRGRTITIFASEGIIKAITDAGYKDIGHWLREAKRLLILKGNNRRTRG